MVWPASSTRLVVPVLLTVVTLDIVRRIYRNRIERKGYPLPPGPGLLAISGSATFLYAGEPWLRCTEWQAKYGECGVE